MSPAPLSGSNAAGLRCPHRSVVVFAGGASASEAPARALERRLEELGVQTRYVGRENDASRLAALAVSEQADAIEVCLAPETGGVRLLRALLRELIEIGRRDVSIVVHRPRA